MDMWFARSVVLFLSVLIDAAIEGTVVFHSGLIGPIWFELMLMNEGKR